MITDLITLDRPLISIDCETTGLNHRQDRIVQLGLVKLYPDGKLTEFETLINPGIPISEEVSAIHHITDARVAEEPSFADMANVLYAGLKECDIIGYNVFSFDIKFLQSEFLRAHIRFIVPRVIDSFKIFTKHHPRNLVSAVKHYLGEDLIDAHSALADARASMRVFEAQLLKHPELPRNIQELHDHYFPRNKDAVDPDSKVIFINEEACINFGKHKGIALRLIPVNYRQWLAHDKESTDELKFIMKESLAGRFPVRGVSNA